MDPFLASTKTKRVSLCSSTNRYCITTRRKEKHTHIHSTLLVLVELCFAYACRSCYMTGGDVVFFSMVLPGIIVVRLVLHVCLCVPKGYIRKNSTYTYLQSVAPIWSCLCLLREKLIKQLSQAIRFAAQVCVLCVARPFIDDDL